jgi:hypothetical protein
MKAVCKGKYKSVAIFNSFASGGDLDLFNGTVFIGGQIPQLSQGPDFSR